MKKSESSSYLSKIFVGLFFVFLSGKLLAQGPGLVWARQIEETNNIIFSWSIIHDKSGNVYYTGLFSGTVDFDPGTNIFNLVSSSTNLSKRDVFISKLDSKGNFYG
jgi:hypothetical protein